jgi:beta-glucanase (GH16 family)
LGLILSAPPLTGATPTYLFHDEFDGPAGSAPDRSKWTPAQARETIRNPVFWDKPENMGQYRDDRQHWWLSNDHPEVGGEIDMAEWYGNANWPSGTTVHAKSDGTSFATQPFPVDSAWHTWRVTWNDAGMYFWMDYVDGAQPYFEVPAFSLDGWPSTCPTTACSPC